MKLESRKLKRKLEREQKKQNRNLYYQQKSGKPKSNVFVVDEQGKHEA